jgi:hypothetical protein
MKCQCAQVRRGAGRGGAFFRVENGEKNTEIANIVFFDRNTPNIAPHIANIDMFRPETRATKFQQLQITIFSTRNRPQTPSKWHTPIFSTGKS